MAGRERSGIAHADADLFCANTSPSSARLLLRTIRAFRLRENPRKNWRLPLWLGAQQHDYAVGLASHLPQLAAVALAGFLYDHLDETDSPSLSPVPPSRLAAPCRQPYSTWRDIVLTNQEVLSAALDLFARRLDDLREKLASRELEADFDAANELYKLLRSL